MKDEVPALTGVGLALAGAVLFGAVRWAKATDPNANGMRDWSAAELAWKINNEVRAMVKAQEIDQAKPIDQGPGDQQPGVQIEPMPENVRQENRKNFQEARQALLSDLAALNGWAQRTQSASSPGGRITLGSSGHELERDAAQEQRR